MIFSLMQLFGLIMILNFTAVQGCRFDMKFNERVRVCSQCKNKEVVGKFHCKNFQIDSGKMSLSSYNLITLDKHFVTRSVLFSTFNLSKLF